VLIVDAANVVGSVPDGWWRDRAGAARRLREALAEVAVRGLAQLAGPVEVILVVEGAASGVESSETVAVHTARGSGDDAIADLVRERRGQTVVVVTSDRGLRERVLALGATTVGPRSLPYPRNPGRP
jgi:uncharacterized protein YaiI (UPF0178 family)